VAIVSLAGIHHPDTAAYFGDICAIDVTDELAERGWSAEGRRPPEEQVRLDIEHGA
jgi:hypothetical protein